MNKSNLDVYNFFLKYNIDLNDYNATKKLNKLCYDYNQNSFREFYLELDSCAGGFLNKISIKVLPEYLDQEPYKTLHKQLDYIQENYSLSEQAFLSAFSEFTKKFEKDYPEKSHLEKCNAVCYFFQSTYLTYSELTLYFIEKQLDVISSHNLSVEVLKKKIANLYVSNNFEKLTYLVTKFNFSSSLKNIECMFYCLGGNKGQDGSDNVKTSFFESLNQFILINVLLKDSIRSFLIKGITDGHLRPLYNKLKDADYNKFFPEEFLGIIPATIYTKSIEQGVVPLNIVPLLSKDIYKEMIEKVVDKNTNRVEGLNGQQKFLEVLEKENLHPDLIQYTKETFDLMNQSNVKKSTIQKILEKTNKYVDKNILKKNISVKKSNF